MSLDTADLLGLAAATLLLAIVVTLGRRRTRKARETAKLAERPWVCYHARFRATLPELPGQRSEDS